jgi:AcrR family transcriptional regulator
MASVPEHLRPVSVGKERLPKSVREDYQRQRVLDAAAKVFAKRGFPGTTVDHLVSAAQIGVGNFYVLFDGKEDCFLQLYGSIRDSWREQIAARIETEGEWSGQVRDSMRALLELIASEPAKARIVLVEAQIAGRASLALYEETIDELVPQLRRGRELSPVADELPPALEVATVGGLLWFLQQRIVNGETKGIEESLPDLIRIVVEPYLGEEGATRLVQSG